MQCMLSIILLSIILVRGPCLLLCACCSCCALPLLLQQGQLVLQLLLLSDTSHC